MAISYSRRVFGVHGGRTQQKRPPRAGGPLPSDSAVKQPGYFTSVIFSIFS